MNGFRWAQGEHLVILAPTGAGKTTLISEILPKRKFNIIFGTKKADDMYDFIVKKRGFRAVESFDEIKHWERNILLWPKHESVIRQTYAKQKNVFTDALNHIVKQGSWTIWLDEMKYMHEQLRMGPEITFLYEQMRSMKSSVIGAAQRPAFVPQSALTNATHSFLWKTTKAEDAKRIADIGGIDSKEIMAELKTLGAREFVYIKTRGTEAHIVRSQVERKA